MQAIDCKERCAKDIYGGTDRVMPPPYSPPIPPRPQIPPPPYAPPIPPRPQMGPPIYMETTPSTPLPPIFMPPPPYYPSRG